MHKAYKEKWVKALRSGKYNQAKGQLVRERGDDKTYCCLGVLCDLVRNDENLNGIGLRMECNEALSININGESGGVVPIGTRTYLELIDGNPTLNFRGREGTSQNYIQSLANLNDDGMSFEQIADVIENKL